MQTLAKEVKAEENQLESFIKECTDEMNEDIQNVGRSLHCQEKEGLLMDPPGLNASELTDTSPPSRVGMAASLSLKQTEDPPEQKEDQTHSFSKSNYTLFKYGISSLNYFRCPKRKKSIGSLSSKGQARMSY